MPSFLGGYPSYVRQNDLISDIGRYDAKPQFKDYTAEIEQRLKNYRPTGPTFGGSGSDIDRFLAAISGQESGGNYGIVNPDSGALGKYQIMPMNLAGWSRAAGMNYTPSRSQFLNDPQMQELIARTQIQNALNRYGDYGQVAAWWYGGEGGRQKYASGGGTSGEAGGYPSIRAYVDQVLKRMNGR